MNTTTHPLCIIATNATDKIKTKLHNTTVSYKIWNYDKNYICFNEKREILNCRSVIFSHPENKILSCCPGKTISKNTFCEKYNYNENMYVNEYIDGSLIHLFYDERISSWEIATKSAIGGNYYPPEKNKITSFHDMFINALMRNNKEDKKTLSDCEMLNDFPKQYCYIFNLLHPDNIFVYPVLQPMLYLTAIYEVHNENNHIYSISPLIYEKWICFQNTTILFPNSKKIKSWKELTIYNALCENAENTAGYMVYDNKTGERASFINHSYKELLELRKMDSEFMLHYLCLRRIDLINNFVTIFPEFRKTFFQFREYIHKYISKIHQAYLTKYVWVGCRNFEIPYKYDKYISAIHREIYIPSLKTGKKKITNKIVHDYIMKKPPGEILYMLYHEKRTILR